MPGIKSRLPTLSLILPACGVLALPRQVKSDTFLPCEEYSASFKAKTNYLAETPLSLLAKSTCGTEFHMFFPPPNVWI
jgi:hypothetical protein